jgi:hypothetical protein
VALSAELGGATNALPRRLLTLPEPLAGARRAS